MVNEVNPIGNKPVGNPTAGTGRSAGAQAKPDAAQTGSSDSATSSSASAQDTVNLSEQGQEIARLQRALAQLPDIDSARVSEIREQISSGSYSVDVEALAEKILASDLLLDS